MKTPLYTTGRTADGIETVGGLFTARDQEGVPLELMHDLLRSAGFAVDWVEYLADSGRQDDDFKTDAALEQIVAVAGQEVAADARARFVLLGAAMMPETGGGFPAICRAIVERKRRNGRAVDLS